MPEALNILIYVVILVIVVVFIFWLVDRVLFFTSPAIHDMQRQLQPEISIPFLSLPLLAVASHSVLYFST
jgi:hypothetical protein